MFGIRNRINCFIFLSLLKILHAHWYNFCCRWLIGFNSLNFFGIGAIIKFGAGKSNNDNGDDRQHCNGCRLALNADKMGRINGYKETRYKQVQKNQRTPEMEMEEKKDAQKKEKKALLETESKAIAYLVFFTIQWPGTLCSVF